MFFTRPNEHFPIGVERWRDEWISEWNDFVDRSDSEERVTPSLGAPTAEGALRFHFLDSNPLYTERAEFLPTFGAVVSEGLRRREAEREARVASAEA
jgi:hypothetical protein